MSGCFFFFWTKDNINYVKSGHSTLYVNSEYIGTPAYVYIYIYVVNVPGSQALTYNVL